MNSFVDWPHAPPHRLGATGAYFVTASTYRKEHIFAKPLCLDVLQRGLISITKERGWSLEAWAIFSNHYHFVARSPKDDGDASTLSPMLSKLHEKMAKWVNRVDGTPGRKVWHNYRETHLSFQASYLALLHYVHTNPVRHGLVPVANQYRWCSAGWFERSSDPSHVQTVYGFKIDRLSIVDEFEPIVG